MLKKIQKYGRSLCAVLVISGTCMTFPPATASIITSQFLDLPGVDDWTNGTFTRAAADGPDGPFWWGGASQTDGWNYTVRPMTIHTATQTMVGGFESNYVPTSQEYRLRLHMCPAGGRAKRCTTNETIGFLDSNTYYLKNSETITSQNPRFLFNTGGTIPADTSLCYTFVSNDGREYHTPAWRTCQDSESMPDHPLTCSASGDISVDFGSLERSKIATNYKEGTSEKRAVQVICSGDKSATYEITFAYTPVTVAGIESIQTTSTGLSVVMLLDDQPVGPSSAPVTKAVQSGTSNIILGFVAVRDPNVNVANVPTGNFTVSASMIMTEQ